MPSNNAQQPIQQPQAQPQQSAGLDPAALNLTKAIRQNESGGDFTKAGKSGEYGAYQFLPATWDSYSREAGVSVPLAQATPEQQNEVAYKKIKQWKDAGYNVGQIASMWNAGPGKPNAYVEGNAGTNAEGVSYDTKAYAQKVAQTYQQLKTQAQVSGPQTAAVANQPTQQQDQGGGGIGGFLKSAADFAFPIAGDVYNDVTGKNTKSFGQQAGDALLSGSWFVPGVGEAVEGARGLLGAGKAASAVEDILAHNAAGAVDAGAAGKLASAAKVASPSSGLLPSLLKSPLATGATIGYTQDVGSKLSQGQGLGQSLVPGAGTVTGAALGGLGGALGKLVDALPTRLAQGALKVDPATASYALENRGIGTVAKMSRDTQAARNAVSGDIQSVLHSDQYATHMGNGSGSLEDAAASYPHGKVTAKDIYSNAQNLLGKPYAGLLGKLKKGTATLAEKNTVRSALDSATRSVYREGVARPTETKNLGNALADALRNEVQGTAKETVPMFAQLQKEVQLGNALGKLSRRSPNSVVGLRDLLSIIGGGAAAGPIGAAGGFLGDKLVTTPGGQFALAKGAKAISPFVKGAGSLTKLLSTRAAAGAGASPSPTQ